MARYMGSVPQKFVNAFGPFLSSDENLGKVIAEECFRDENTRPMILKHAGKAHGAEVPATDEIQLPPLLGGVKWKDIFDLVRS